MEELGIGRPSTYTAILTVLKDRGYVHMDQRRLIPEDKGRLVTAFLESFFTRYVQYDFTADLEEQLDKVSAGDKNWKQLLAEFWKDFSSQIDETRELRVTNVLDALNDLLEAHVFPEREDGKPRRSCPSCENGQLSLKLGKFGAFVGCSNYPECRYTRQLGTSGEGDAIDYADWKIGVTYPVGKFTLGLAYTDTDEEAFGKYGDERLIVSVGTTF